MSTLPPSPPIGPLLERASIESLQRALLRADYTVDGVGAALGAVGASALGRGDLAGAALALAPGDRTGALIRLFMLGGAVELDAAARALPGVDIGALVAAGFLEASGGQLRGAIDMRPYAEADALAAIPGAAAPLAPALGADLAAGLASGSSAGLPPRDAPDPWWVVSDPGSDVRPGPLRPDHVLGVGAAALTLAQATPRRPAQRALDVGTGCGIQALHLSRHAAEVTATDISRRALRMAATTAALSGRRWRLLPGDLLDPVAGERFDLVVANPPFVVGPGWGDGRAPGTRKSFDYRDSGAAGDALCERLVRSLPAALAPGGTAQILANWIIGADGDWAARLEDWLAGSGCDAWIWQREVAEPGEYAALWLRDGGESPGTPAWADQYERWTRWFARNGVLAIGMGMITLRRVDADRPTVVAEDVPQALEQPIGAEVAAWLDRASWLRGLGADRGAVGRLFEQRVRRAPDLVLTTHSLAGDDGWSPAASVLRRNGGMRWELDVDDALCALTAGCTGQATLGELADVLAASVGAPPHAVRDALAPVLVDMLRRGLLLPA